MPFHLTTRMGSDESEPTPSRMQAVLAELYADDTEHPDVSLTHESEWSLGAFSNGLLIWENLESGEPRHMNGVPRQRVLELWLKLAQCRIDEIGEEPWLPGYKD